MKKSVYAAVALAASAVLSGCGSLNATLADRKETVEMYHIVDIKTQASTDVTIKALADGLARNTNSIRQNRPLQMGVGTPETPDRFELANPLDAFQGTGLGVFAALAQGQAGQANLRVAKCDTAVWTATANRHIAGSDNLNLYTCLYRYKDGYHLNIYAVFQKTSGGLAQLSRNLAHSVVGTPEQWVNTTILETLASVKEKTGGTLTYLEGQPTLERLSELNIAQADAAVTR